MATQTRNAPVQNRWVRPLVPVVVLVVIGALLIVLGALITQAQGNDASNVLGSLRWLPFLLVGGVVAYGSIVAAQSSVWSIGTREVVYMAIGAALYAVLSWATVWLQIPSVSAVSIRPAIVIPVFFGVVFGPAVGFFTGFAGNVLGDVLSGWGVSPTWDVGNGLIGLVAGFAFLFRNKTQSVNVLLGVVVAINLLITALLLAFPNTENALFGDGSTVGAFWWVPLLIIALVVGARFLLRGREDIAAAQLWGAVAIIVGIGFAALADIWWNGYSLLVALLGEFVPAATSNLVNALILLPLLLAAWQAARAQSGR